MKTIFSHIPDATPLEPDDLEGLLLEHVTTRDELNEAEFSKISMTALQYLGRKPSRKKALFTASRFVQLHRQMCGSVWRWGGKLRNRDLNAGIPTYQIAAELKKTGG
jgi:fido (protein-threonine AMPylation protein)